MSENVSAVVVTFNRLALLKQCLKALESQTLPLSHIIVVDNNSQDGTQDYLKKISSEKVMVKELHKNLGGAGGFYNAIKEFQEKTKDSLVWVMDDDTIPEKKALSELVKAKREVKGFGFLASNVRWIDRTSSVMNVPKVDGRRWNDYLSDKNEDFYPLIKSASFVSIMTSREVVKEVGLPLKEFFIWGDDVEYTERISSKYQSFFVSRSIVIHKTKQNFGVDILQEKGSRINRYFYDVRNKIYLARQKKMKSRIKTHLNILWILLKLLVTRNVPQRWKKIAVVIKALCVAPFFRPKVHFSNF